MTSRPTDDDAVVPVALGTAMWLAALAALLVARSSLETEGRLWWIGTAAIGAASGLIGLAFLLWRRGRRAQASVQE